ncbi:DNA adenine methylase [Neisseria weixii]|uniref:DNA adenine methylase n=1 Tax=Neisseria weixii TaxID=1853276 RepID=UPI002FC58347
MCFRIHNRYSGSKFKLLAFIENVIRTHCRDCHTFTDLFGGTGVVAHHFNDRFRIQINDTLSGNFLAYQTFFAAEPVNWPHIKEWIDGYNQLTDMPSENYYLRHFAGIFLSRQNMLKVGIIRDDIDALFAQGKINARERAVLITSLLYAIDRIANTVGHYDAFRRSGDLAKPLVLRLPQTQEAHNQGNQIFQQDANELVKSIRSDIVYIDPPYNSRQYGDAYHFLENVAVNAKPEVHGVARKMDRSHLKSGYCTQKAAAEIICLDKNEQLIDLLKFIQSQSYAGLVAQLEQKIACYGLSDTFRHDYDFYECNSNNGLGKFNKQPFARLRQDYNQSKDNLLFLLLIFYGFNNQIRFNQKGEFNLPVGKRDFNVSLRNKLRLFMQRLRTRHIRFACQNFRDLDIEHLQRQNAFLYLDPPYLLGMAAYNEKGGWTAQDERDLLQFLQTCNEHQIRFALSNVMKHKGETHQQLLDWYRAFVSHQLSEFPLPKRQLSGEA